MKLHEHEWRYLLQLVSRIYCAPTYRVTICTLSQQLQTLIPFDKDLFYRTSRENGRPVISDFYTTTDSSSCITETFQQGSYPRWSEFIMSSGSTIFRQSDLVSADHWEKSRVYKNIWEPQNIYYGLFISVVYRDQPLLLFGMLRSRESGDFSERDVFILQLLQDCLEHKFHQLSSARAGAYSAVTADQLFARSAQYQLTKREAEIARLICENKNSEEICGELVISTATLNKHLSNIYAKTNVKGRVQLYQLFSR